MRITQEGDYALRVVLYFCKLGTGERIEAREISKNENIPLRFLLKLLRKLTIAGILKSYRGINGGYSAQKMPEEISLKEVVEAIEGPTYVNRCLYDNAYCNLNRSSTCEIHHVLHKIQESLIDNLNSINFKDILNRSH
jgi:Rrf2 family protein